MKHAKLIRHTDFTNLSRIQELQKLYLKLPVWLQELLVTIEGYRLARRRMGAGFEKIYKEVLNRAFLQGEDLKLYQERRLRNHLEVAATAPYWENKFLEWGINLRAADIFSEFQKLPLVNKTEIRAHALEVRAPLKDHRQIIPTHTGGTTGSGLNFWETIDAERERIATWWRYRQWYGINRSELCGFFSGRVVIGNMDQKKPPFWRLDRFGKRLVFSTHHLTGETARNYLKALDHYQVKWLIGPPSFIAQLAGFILEQKLTVSSSLKAVTTGAENLYPHMRELIQRAFRVPVSQLYCQTEAVANFSECEKGCLHVDEDFSYVEFFPVPEVENAFKVVGTNWTNPAFPLLRYDIGDLVTLSSSPCLCGRPGRIVTSMDGRPGDYIVLKDGRKISRLNFIFQDLVHIREAQLYQDTPGILTIRIVKGEGYDSRHEEKRLIETVRTLLGADLELKIEYHDKLSRTVSGKLQFLISTIT